MKKYSMRVSGLFLIMSLLFIGMGLKNYYQEDKKVQNFKLGVLLYRGDDEFISTVADNMEKQKETFKEKYGQELVITYKDAKQNQSVQNQQIDDMLKNDYDAIAVNIVDRTIASGIIEKAKQADIPVVFFNREPVANDLNRWEKAFYVGSDAWDSGEKEAQIVVNQWRSHQEDLDINHDGILQYVLLEGEEVHQDSLIRTEASIQYLTEAGIKLQRLNRGVADWMRGPAFDLTERWLKEENQIELVISNNDEMALGALEAINAHKKTPFPAVVGIDGTEEAIKAVDNGEMLGTVINFSEKQAETVIELAAEAHTVKGQLISGEPIIDQHYVWIPYKIYSK